MTRIWVVLRWMVGAAILVFAVSILWRQWQSLTLQQIRAAWSGISMPAIVLSVLGTGLSFACLAAYEWFATWKVVPGRVPAIMALRVGAISHAISNTLGFHILTGSTLRYRVYRKLGLTAGDVARVIAAVGACVVIGTITVSAIALGWLQVTASGWPMRLLLASLALLLGYVLSVRLRGRMPQALTIVLRSVGWLALLGVVEMLAAIGALYVLLPATSIPAPAPFALLFVTATVLGVISHAPGGVGVFEATVLAATPAAAHSRVLVALLAYRAIYNLLPFAVSVIVLLLRLLPASARNGDDASV